MNCPVVLDNTVDCIIYDEYLFNLTKDIKDVPKLQSM